MPNRFTDFLLNTAQTAVDVKADKERSKIERDEGPAELANPQTVPVEQPPNVPVLRPTLTTNQLLLIGGAGVLTLVLVTLITKR